jgi:hypothetical protein
VARALDVDNGFIFAVKKSTVALFGWRCGKAMGSPKKHRKKWGVLRVI